MTAEQLNRVKNAIHHALMNEGFRKATAEMLSESLVQIAEAIEEETRHA